MALRAAEPAAVALVVALSVSLVAAATEPFGPATTVDSAAYLSTAHNLVHGRGLATYGDLRLTAFPPGYPLLLSLPLALGSSIELAARIVGLASLVATLVFTWLAARLFLNSPGARVATLAGVACAPTLWLVSVHAWAEPAFTAFTLGGLWALTMASLRIEPSRRWLALSAVLLASACLTRYLGIGTALAATAFVAFKTPSGRRLRAASTYLAITLAPVAAWIGAVAIRSGLRVGPPSGSTESIGEVATGFLRESLHWLVPIGPPQVVRIMLLLAEASLVAWVFHVRRGAEPSRLRPVAAMAGAAGAMAILLIVAEMTTSLDRVDARLMSPMLLVIAVPLASAAYHLSTRRSWPMVATASAWAAVGAWGTIQAVGDMREHGMDYATAAQRPLSLSAAAQTALPVFSNSPALIWLGTRKDARCPPVAVARISCDGVEDNRTLQARLPRRSVLLLFGAEHPHATLPKLGTAVRIVSTRSYADGTSLVLSRR